MMNTETTTPVAATLDSFEDVVTKSEVPVVVDFWAPWCGPCRAIGPILEEMAASWAGKVKLVKANVAQVFRVSGIPTLYGIKGTKVVTRQVGMGNRGQIEAMFRELAA